MERRLSISLILLVLLALGSALLLVRQDHVRSSTPVGLETNDSKTGRATPLLQQLEPEQRPGTDSRQQSSSPFDDQPRSEDESADLEPRRFRLFARTSRSGRPLAGLRLSVTRSQPQQPPAGGTSSHVTDSQGTCEVEIAGSFLVECEDEDWIVSESPLEVPGTSHAGAPHVQEIRLTVVLAGRLVGRVVDARGRAIEEASVVVPQESGSHQPKWFEEAVRKQEPVARTDEAGRFSLPKLAADLVLDLEARAPEYAPATFKGAVVFPRKTTRVPDLVMERGVEMRWRVLDGDDEPIEQAQFAVEPSPTTELSGNPMRPHYGKSDAQGWYSPGRVSPRPLRVAIGRGGYLPFEIVWEPSEEPVTVRLESAAIISGRVLRPIGEPVDGVDVRAFSPSQRKGVVSTRTGREGRFRLYVPPGRFRIAVLDATVREEVPSGTTDLEIVIGQGTIRSRLLDSATGLPANELGSIDIESSPRRHLRDRGKHRDGLIVFERLLPGRYRLTGSRRDHRSVQSDWIELGDGDEVGPIDLTPPPNLMLRGRVMSKDGAPVRRAELTALGLGESPHISTSRSEHNGRFQLELTQPGRYEIVVERAGYADHREEIDIEDSTDRELVLTPAATARVVGRILRDGRPVPDANVGVQSVYAATDEQGAYELGELSPGRALLRIEIGQLQRWQWLELKAGLETRIDVDLASGVQISGRVSAGDEPVPFAQVSIQGVAESRLWSATDDLNADEDGRFSLSGLQPGRYRVSAVAADIVDDVQRSGVAWKWLECPGPGDYECDIQLGEASLVLTAVAADGEPIPEAYAVLRSPQLEGRGWNYGISIRHGQGSAPSVPLGPVEIEVRGRGNPLWISEKRTVEIRPGVNRQSFVLPEGALLRLRTILWNGKQSFGKALLRVDPGSEAIPAGGAVEPGQYEMLAGHYRSGARYLGTVQLVAGEDHTFEVDLRSLRRLTIQAEGASRRPEVSILGPRGFDHAAFGRFPHYHLEPGRYRVTVSDGERSATAEVEMGSQSQRLELEL